MIRTDGTPTIAHYPKPAPVEIQPEQHAHPNALLERRDGGVYVALAFLPIVDLVGIQVQVGDEVAWATVEKHNALDAFDHPTLYLSDAQVKALFERKPDA